MILLKRNLLLAIVLLLLVSSLSIAQTSLTDKLPIDPKVKIGKLANGLTYYIRKNVKPENKVELRLVVNTGSIMEDDDQQGLAHFTEHMAFNGTEHFQKNALVSFLQTIGVKFGADLNAYTSFDETVYILPIPTDKKENIDKGFQVLEDWASTLTFDDDEIDKERGVVLEESRLGKGSRDRINKILYPKLFEGSKYAQRLPIGKEEILKGFKHDVLKKFYKDWYRPDLMAVIVVGDIEPAQAEQLIKQHFEKLKAPATPRPRKPSEIPVRKKSEGLVITDKEATNSMLQIFHSLAKSKEDETLGDYRQTIVKGMCSSMLNQRLQELTQQAEPPFVFGSSGLGGFVRGYEVFSSFAYLGKAGVKSALSALVEENERARKFGFTMPELERIKKNMLKSLERAYNERDKSESRTLVQEYIRNFLEGEAMPGIEKEYAYYQEFVPTITLEEVNKYAADNIPRDDEQLVVLTAPEKTDYTLPSNEELLAMAAAASKIEVSAYEEKAVAESLLEKIPAPGKIVSEQVNMVAGFTELKLSNGIRVILKPTDFKNDQVLMSAVSFGGEYQYNAADRLNVENAATLVSQMGVGNFSPVDLGKVLSGKTVSVSPYISSINDGLSGQSGASDIESLFQLTYLYMTQPRKDEALFQSFISKQQALYANVMSEPRTVFRDSIFSILYKHHPWAPRIPSPSDFTKIDLTRVMDIYKERFDNAAGYTFVFVGSFTVEQLKPLIATYLASIPASGAAPIVKDVGLRPATGVKKKVFSGTEPKSFIFMQFSGAAKYSKEEAFKLKALIDVVNIKLLETLREEMSGIYGGSMYGSLSKYPYSNYSIGVSLPCGPENVDKLAEATLNEVTKVKKNGPLEADLNKVKETWKKQYEEGVKTNGFWLRQLQDAMQDKNDPNEILSFGKKVDALTVADLKKIANKYFVMKNFVQIVLYPESGEE